VRCARRWLRELRCERAFRHLMKQEQFAAVYVNTIVSIAAAVAARRCGIPCLWHIRELFDDVGGEMVIPALGGRALVRKIVWRHADWIVVNSRSVAQNILGCTQHSRLSVVPNSAPEELFDDVEDRSAARQSLGVPADSFVIGVPGTLRPMKGHGFFIAAAAKAAQRMSDSHFFLTGDGESDYVASLRDQVRDLRMSHNLRFTGRIDDMRSFYAACDLICVPSRAEPFGRVAIEAFAAGRAVIASDVGGLAEIIQHQENGILVPYADTDALADALVTLRNSSEQRDRLAAAARRTAQERYTEEIYSQRIIEAVTQIGPISVECTTPSC